MPVSFSAVLRRLAPVLAAAVLVTACGSGSDEAASTTSTTTPQTAPSSPAPGGDGSGVVTADPLDAPEALQFSSPLVGGGDIELTTLAGRPVLLWFWAPW